MERFINSKIEKQTIYEIYRACRLCGAGGGYKMPIIQNVVDLDGSDVELRQKIRECVQIEVHQDDKMPPLICELCVDKVNDFYEFLEMCRQTNKRTRLRLGLPPQRLPQGAPDAGDCILGVTEPIYMNNDDEPLSKKKGQKATKGKKEKEPEIRVKIESELPKYRESRSSSSSSRCSRSTRRAPTPPPPPRTTRRSQIEDDVALSRLQHQGKKSSSSAPKGILKKEIKTEDSLLTPRLQKRVRDKEPVKAVVPLKKVKITIKPVASSKQPKQAAKPPPPAAPPTSPPPRPCPVCKQQFKTPQSVTNHLRSHLASYTNAKLACNACGEWFSTLEEAARHHRRHQSGKPYHCSRCETDFKQQQAYSGHLESNQCVPWPEVPDVQCPKCWRYFPTNNLMKQHKCPGEGARPGGKCSKCCRNYATLKSLNKHACFKKKGELIVDPELLGRLKPIQVRVARCDPLLANVKQEHYDVSSITHDFGLDRNCVYPYISSVESVRIKMEPSINEYDSMVNIKEEIKDEFFAEEDYVHWDSDCSSDSDDQVTSSLVVNPFAKSKRVDSLSTLSLKTIFSQRFLGKVPRKRRKVKTEKENLFDSLMNMSEFDNNIRKDIDDIIGNLCNESADTLNDSDVNSGVASAATGDPAMDTDNNDGSVATQNDETTERNDSDINLDSSDDINRENTSDSLKNTNSDFDDLFQTVERKSEENNDNVNSSNDFEDTLLQDKDNTDDNDDNDAKDSVVESDQTEMNSKTNTEAKDETELQTVTEENTVTDNESTRLNCNTETKDVNNENEGKNNEDQDDGDVNERKNQVYMDTEDVNHENKYIKDDEHKEKGEVETSNLLSEHSEQLENDSGRTISDVEPLTQQVNVKNKENNDETSKTNLMSEQSKINEDLVYREVISETNAENFTVQIPESNLIDKDLESIDKANNTDEVSVENNKNSSELMEENSKEIDVGLDNTTASEDKSVKDVSFEDTSVNDVRKNDSDDKFSADKVSSEKTINGVTDERPSDKFNIEDLEEVSDTELDDKRLMEALDAQIGENKDKSENNAGTAAGERKNDTSNERDKITLEDLLLKKDSDVKSMDLDSISDDEFNFDA